MMRKPILFLFGAGLVMTGYSQTMLDQSLPSTRSKINNEESGLDIGVDQIRTRGPEVNIFTNDAENVVGEEAIATNKVKRSRVGFLMSTGVEYTDEGEYEEAEKAYLRALETDEQNPEILFRLGGLYVEMERFNDAVEIFKTQAERFPENPLPHNNLAWCYATGPKIRNTELALRHARKALLYAPTNPSIWNTLAECYYVAADYNKALRSAEYALELLQRMNPDRETVEAYWTQREKILRAQQARNVLEGLEENE